MIRWAWASGRDGTRTTTARDALAVVAATVALILLTNLAQLGSARTADLTTVLALAAAAAGATSAILSRMSARLRDDPRSLWLCLALLLYTMAAIPAATIGATSQWDAAAVGNVRLFAHTAFVALTYLVVLAPPMPRWFTVTSGLAALLSAAGALMWLGETFPQASLTVTTEPAARYGLTCFWLVPPVLLMLTGLRGDSRALYRIGVALAIISAAHAYRVNQGNPAVPLDLTFSTIRLLGMGLMLMTMVRLAGHHLEVLDVAHSDQQEELRLAIMRLERVTERDHELRNGLAGLVSAADLLQPDHDDETAILQQAVTTELSRLNVMLCEATGRNPGAGAAVRAAETYSVELVLRNQVALRQATGMAIRLDVDPHLHTTGSSSALAQVMSNLLVNCDRHAPGSPVHVQATGTGPTIAIRVTDSGPGIPQGREREMFRLGTCGDDSSGQGIGLHVSRRLLHQDAGTITISPTRHGCSVLIELPRATPVKTASTIGTTVDDHNILTVPLPA